jgi:hypothetical protein
MTPNSKSHSATTFTAIVEATGYTAGQPIEVIVEAEHTDADGDHHAPTALISGADGAQLDSAALRRLAAACPGRRRPARRRTTAGAVSLHYRVEWSQDDGEWVGLVDEFPSLSWLAADPAEAMQGIRDLAESVVADTRP